MSKFQQKDLKTSTNKRTKICPKITKKFKKKKIRKIIGIIPFLNYLKTYKNSKKIYLQNNQIRPQSVQKNTQIREKVVQKLLQNIPYDSYVKNKQKKH